MFLTQFASPTTFHPLKWWGKWGGVGPSGNVSSEQLGTNCTFLTCHLIALGPSAYTAVPGVRRSHLPFRRGLIVVFLTLDFRVIHRQALSSWGQGPPRGYFRGSAYSQAHQASTSLVNHTHICTIIGQVYEDAVVINTEKFHWKCYF